MSQPVLEHQEFDPDAYRMTMGEHLEELRRRLLFGIVGLAIAAGVCFYFGERVMGIFILPLTRELERQHLNPQLVTHELGDGFLVYMKVSVICAVFVSAPWMAYQLWQFVAAGLYPRERKYITRYIPLSIGLLIAGMLFVYYVILPWTISFFLIFNGSISAPGSKYHAPATNMPTGGLPVIPMLDGDPAHPIPGNFWFNTVEGQLKLVVTNGDLRVLQLNAVNLLTPQLSLTDYIDMVITTLLTFGLCFQLPLVVMALAKIGIVPVSGLRKGRRYVYFALSIVAATLTPGDLVTAMLALMAPLIVLYELGIFLAAWGTRRDPEINPADAADA